MKFIMWGVVALVFVCNFQIKAKEDLLKPELEAHPLLQKTGPGLD